MKLFNPRSWKPWNRAGLEAAWKIGLPVGLVFAAFQIMLWWLMKGKA